ncbi:hypothetical protein IJ670_07890 [bacterium]|nr:hypothetical protein [bacterium]
MPDSLYNTVKQLKNERKVNIEELEIMLDTDIENVVALCKKACLKPKTDALGNTYFSGEDVDILKKMQELYAQSQTLQKGMSEDEAAQKIIEGEIEDIATQEDLTSPSKKVNFLTKAKNRLHQTTMPAVGGGIQAALQKFEDNLTEKISNILSEKMDGFDEIIVELIRSKTENETLRSQVNDLNKQVFILKKELSCYTPLPFGLYTKKENDEL